MYSICHCFIEYVVYKYLLLVYNFSFHLSRIFHRAKFLILLRLDLSIFPLTDYTFGVKSENFWPSPVS